MKRSLSDAECPAQPEIEVHVWGVAGNVEVHQEAFLSVLEVSTRDTF